MDRFRSDRLKPFLKTNSRWLLPGGILAVVTVSAVLLPIFWGQDSGPKHVWPGQEAAGSPQAPGMPSRIPVRDGAARPSRGSSGLDLWNQAESGSGARGQNGSREDSIRARMNKLNDRMARLLGDGRRDAVQDSDERAEDRRESNKRTHKGKLKSATLGKEQSGFSSSGGSRSGGGGGYGSGTDSRTDSRLAKAPHGATASRGAGSGQSQRHLKEGGRLAIGAQKTGGEFKPVSRTNTGGNWNFSANSGGSGFSNGSGFSAGGFNKPAGGAGPAGSGDTKFIAPGGVNSGGSSLGGKTAGMNTIGGGSSGGGGGLSAAGLDDLDGENGGGAAPAGGEVGDSTYDDSGFPDVADTAPSEEVEGDDTTDNSEEAARQRSCDQIWSECAEFNLQYEKMISDSHDRVTSCTYDEPHSDKSGSWTVKKVDQACYNSAIQLSNDLRNSRDSGNAKCEARQREVCGG